MPVPIPGLKVGSDGKKVKFLTIFGRPKTGIFRRFRGVPGGPNPGDMDTLAARTILVPAVANSVPAVETSEQRQDSIDCRARDERNCIFGVHGKPGIGAIIDAKSTQNRSKAQNLMFHGGTFG